MDFLRTSPVIEKSVDPEENEELIRNIDERVTITLRDGTYVISKSVLLLSKSPVIRNLAGASPLGTEGKKIDRFVDCNLEDFRLIIGYIQTGFWPRSDHNPGYLKAICDTLGVEHKIVKKKTYAEREEKRISALRTFREGLEETEKAAFKREIIAIRDEIMGKNFEEVTIAIQAFRYAGKTKFEHKIDRHKVDVVVLADDSLCSVLRTLAKSPLLLESFFSPFEKDGYRMTSRGSTRLGEIEFSLTYHLLSIPTRPWDPPTPSSEDESGSEEGSSEEDEAPVLDEPPHRLRSLLDE